jgi:hypothetical protein
MSTRLAYADISPQQAKKLLGAEIGTQFDVHDRMFAYWGDGIVFDYSTWSEADMKTMILRDGQAAALEAVLTLPIRQCPWSIMPTKGDKGEAEFVRSVLMAPPMSGGMRTPMQTVIGQMTAAQIYKKAYFEKVFTIRPDDGMIIYDKLAYRPPSTCQVRRKAENSEFDGFRQQVWLFGGLLADKNRHLKTPGYVDIPRHRSFVYIHGQHREPLQGVSELDLCYWAYQTKLKILYLWYNFIENQALPKVAVYGESQPQADDRALDLAQMRASGVVGWERSAPDMKTFDIIETNGRGSDQFQAALSFLETWQTASVLAGFTGLSSLASLGRGSLALSSDQSAFFLKSRQAITQELQSDITIDLIAPLVAYNFGSDAAFPTFAFGPLIDDNAAALTTMFQTLAVAPSLQVPVGIMDLITERIATVLDLDIDAVDEIVQSAAKERAAQAAANPGGMPPGAAAQLGGLAGGVNAATNIVQKALKQSANSPRASIMNQPFTQPNVSSTGAGNNQGAT